MISETVRKWVAETRAKQGLPPRVEDPEILETVAAIVTSDRRRANAEEPRRSGARP